MALHFVPIDISFGMMRKQKKKRSFHPCDEGIWRQFAYALEGGGPEES